MKIAKGAMKISAVLAVFWFMPAHAGTNGCSNESLNGKFDVTVAGEIVGTGPFSVVGRATFDGQGNVSHNIAHIVINGVQPSEDWITGTGSYNVDSDCTGRIHLVFDNGLTRDVLIVVTKNGHELRGVVADQGFNAVADGIE